MQSTLDEQVLSTTNTNSAAREEVFNPALFSQSLAATVAEHAMGNYRVLTNMAAELLANAAREERTELDEKLFLDVFGAQRTAAKKPRRTA